jgi:hypothetical protein
MTQENTTPPNPLKTLHTLIQGSLHPHEDETPEEVMAKQIKALDQMFRSFVVVGERRLAEVHFYTAALRAQNQYRYTHKHLTQLQNKSAPPPKT